MFRVLCFAIVGAALTGLPLCVREAKFSIVAPLPRPRACGASSLDSNSTTLRPLLSLLLARVHTQPAEFMEPEEESLQNLGGNSGGEDVVGRPPVPALEASSDAPSPTRNKRSTRRTSSVSKAAGPPPYRSRSLAAPLPAAFPPPPRGRVAIASDGDGDEDSTNRTSPEIDQSRVAAQGLDVGHELELSVPSHQEHLTADGQR